MLQNMYIHKKQMLSLIVVVLRVPVQVHVSVFHVVILFHLIHSLMMMSASFYL